MREFDQLCRAFEEMDAASYAEILAQKSATILPSLSVLSENGETGTAVFATFILGAIAADGRLSEEEYLLVLPLLKAFFGDTLDYESCRRTVASMKKETRELKKEVDLMVDLLGLVSEGLKEDIIIVCMMICAVDGKISMKEKRWIRRLIA